MTLLALALAIASLRSQTLPKSTTSFKSESEIVLVDVVVTDSKDNPVSDLRQSDFQVREDGIPQSISFFEEHKGAGLAPVKISPMPPHVFTNFEPVQLGDGANVLLLDWLNTQPQDQASVRTEVTKYLQSLPSGTRLAIFTLGSGLHMVQGFTSSLTGLQAALNAKATPQVSPLLPTHTGEAAEKAMIRMMQMSRASPDAIDAAKQEMTEYSGSETDQRVRITLDAFQQLARYLSAIPGRNL